MHKDYDIGYAKGFAEGWTAARKSFDAQLKQAIEQSNNKYELPLSCPVCGIGKNGDPLGLVCQHPDCPTKSTSIFKRE